MTNGSARTEGGPRVQTPSDARVLSDAEGQIPGGQLLLWGFRNVQLMMELNQELFRIGFDLMSHQQAAAAEMMRRSLQAASEAAGTANDGGFASAALSSMEAFDRMLASMQVRDDAGRSSAEGSGQKTEAAEPRSGR